MQANSPAVQNPYHGNRSLLPRLWNQTSLSPSSDQVSEEYIVIRPSIESHAAGAEGDAVMVMEATRENAQEGPSDHDDISLRSGIGTVSDIYPEDSVSVRDLHRRRQPYAWMMDDQSNSPSVVSYHSGEDRNLFRDFYGRTFSDHDKYLLPADGDEHSRLDRQHLLHLMYLDGLYPEKELVEQALRPKDPPPCILDVGTGSGQWALDMAKKFPHAGVVGLDLVPPVLVTDDEIPGNCRFEIDDANLSFEHYELSFDLVHVRSADTGIRDLNGWLYEIAKTLRPGGILIIANGSMQKYDEHLNPIPLTYPGEPGFWWIQHTWGTVYEGFQSKGNYSVDNPMHWDDWLRANPNFQHICRRDHYVPIGPWKPNMSEKEVFISNLMREAEIRVLHAFKPLMLSQGHEEADIDMWIDRSIAEVRDMTLHGHTSWQYTVAMRNEQPWRAQSEVPRTEPEFPRRRLLEERRWRSWS